MIRFGQRAATVGPSIGALRSAREGVDLRPYERVMPEDRPERAQKILAVGWALGRFPAIPMAPPIAWDEVAAEHRSWHYHLHCWDGLAPLLAAHAQTGDEDILRAA